MMAAGTYVSHQFQMFHASSRLLVQRLHTVSTPKILLLLNGTPFTLIIQIKASCSSSKNPLKKTVACCWTQNDLYNTRKTSFLALVISLCISVPRCV